MAEAENRSIGHVLPIEVPRVTLKLKQSSYEEENRDGKLILALLDRAMAGSADGARVQRLFTRRTPQEIDNLVKRATCLDPTYEPVNLNAWFQVFLRTSTVNPSAAQQSTAQSSTYAGELPDFSDRKQVLQLATRLSALPEVESVGVPQHAPSSGPSNTAQLNTTVDHGYLNPAPEGLNFQAAWSYPGSYPNQPLINLGAGIKLADVENGWKLPHEALPGPSSSNQIIDIPGYLPTSDENEEDHGTQVLGVLFMVHDNPKGWYGIAPAGQGYTSGVQFETDVAGQYSTSVESAVLESFASGTIGFGDVMLLECEWGPYDNPAGPGLPQVYLPAEANPAVFETVRLATALGIVVVEAAGNHGVDLDSWVDPSNTGNGQIFNRATSDFRDSGAIMVGAVNPADLTPWQGGAEGTNYGSRIDVFAWGDNIWTTRSLPVDNSYTTLSQPFGATSGAAAIIAGAVMVLQGVSETNQQCRYSPADMRNLLANDPNATKRVDPNAAQRVLQAAIRAAERVAKENAQHAGLPPPAPRQLPALAPWEELGVMPNLGTLCNTVGQQHPDIYIRKSPSDNGSIPFSDVSMLSSCSDIIVGKNASGQINSISVQVRNCGYGNAKSPINVDVYWAPSSTLPLVTDWKDANGKDRHVGGATYSSDIPAGNNGVVINVPAAAQWGASVASNVQYSFLAIVSSDQDLAPQIPDVLAVRNSIVTQRGYVGTGPPNYDPETDVQIDAEVLKYYQTFLQNNNNIAINNVSQLMIPNITHGRVHPRSPFAWRTDPHGRGKTGNSWESYGKLPPNTKVCIRMPMALARLLKLGLRLEWITGCDACESSEVATNDTSIQQCNHDGGFVEYPVRAQGHFLVAEAEVDAGIVFTCELIVDVTDSSVLDPNVDYYYSIRQLLGGTEMGRLTWKVQLASKTKVAVPGRAVEHAPESFFSSLRWIGNRIVAAFGFGRND